tara:strand:+ start:322 stop:1017 length:696 start_codon:yes stop_codon:yes gene_type:complete
VSLAFGLFPLLALVEGIRLGEDLAPFFRNVGPFILSLLLVCYVSYSYRMVVERESGSSMVIFSRQILHSSIRFRKREFNIDQLYVRQITMGGGEDSGPTDYTTVVVDGKDFFTYIGHKRKILKAIPELNKKLQIPDVSLTMRKKEGEENEHRESHSKDVWVGPDGTESGPGVPEDWYLSYDGPAPKVEAVYEDNYGVDRGNGAIPVDFYINKWGVPEGFGPTKQEEIWWDQ